MPAGKKLTRTSFKEDYVYLCLGVVYSVLSQSNVLGWLKAIAKSLRDRGGTVVWWFTGYSLMSLGIYRVMTMALSGYTTRVIRGKVVMMMTFTLTLDGCR